MSASEDLRAYGAELNRRLLVGDETATSRIAEVFLSALVSRLERKFMSVRDSHLLETAAHDALLSYFAHPEKFDPNRLSLASYLWMSAQGDLLNALKQRSIEEARMAEADVENEQSAPEQERETERDSGLWTPMAESGSETTELLAKLVPDPTDRRITELMIEGARETVVFAEVLGVQHKSTQVQRRIVKQHKDRIKKTIQRGIRRHRDDSE